MEETKDKGIYMETGRRVRFYTINLVPGQKVYDERLFREKGVEFREWSVHKSKIGAALAKNICPLGIKENDYILYLGVASGTTASHLSDMIGLKGLIFGIDIAPRSLRDFYFLAKKRKNLVPILADCNKPDEYANRICMCDFLVQDIAQKNQLEIFLKNMKFLKQGGRAFLEIKERSIDVTKNPRQIFEAVKRELEQKKIKILDYQSLDPFEKDHCVFVIEK